MGKRNIAMSAVEAKCVLFTHEFGKLNLNMKVLNIYIVISMG